MVKRAPIALALDAPNLDVMKDWVTLTSPYLSCMKVGLETFLHSGRKATDLVHQFAPECDLFLDLKLHDIPQTVANAVIALSDIKPKYLTVHAAGGVNMIDAAVNAARDTKIVAVTILTSLEASDLTAFRVEDVSQVAIALAVQACEAGASAIVCSPKEVREIRNAVGPKIELITPGVRPIGAANSDQKRIMTPREAIAAGSDLLVIGRPITQGEDVAANAQRLAQSLL